MGPTRYPPAQASELVRQAIEVGYRHIDTAQMYANEAEVGRGCRDSGVPRSELFITSKLDNMNHGREDALRTFDQSLKDLGVDYVDSFMIHWPLPGMLKPSYVETWETLIELWKDGRIRNLAVSNFEVEHLERLEAETGVLPGVNQIEAHPFMQNKAVRDWCWARGIIVEAWSPLARGAVLTNPTIGRIAREIGQTPAQVVLRWEVQRGYSVIPKSSTLERMEENLSLFRFSLTPEHLRQLSALDRGEQGRVSRHPNNVNSPV
ncbi:MAG: aldo/keto reductase [Actinomycetaceae bacterium]|nr:aldo/keto reductase [Actinomycetaceae bacterium]